MTYAPPPLVALGRWLVAHGAVNLGVVGDVAHQAKGVSYHLGADKLTTTAYSRVLPRDKAGLTNAASAIDIGKVGGTLVGLRDLSVWLVKQCQAGKCPDIREVIHSPDGKTVWRWDSVGNALRTGPGQGDNSHLTHTHVSFWRDSEKRDKVAYFRPNFEKEANPVLIANAPNPVQTLVDVEQGGQVFDLNGRPLVKWSADATITSLGQSGDYDVIVVTTGGVTQHALVLTAATSNRRPA